MTIKTILPALVLPLLLRAQGDGVSPADLLKPLKDSWPTYNGDYSGRRYSPLAKINTTTVKQLSLAWSFRVETTTGGGKRISATPPLWAETQAQPQSEENNECRMTTAPR